MLGVDPELVPGMISARETTRASLVVLAATVTLVVRLVTGG